MILIDYSAISFAAVLAQQKYIEDFNVDILRHIILNSILSFKKKFSDEYGELVLCMDGPNSWRKDIFPYYKANRKKMKEDNSEFWDDLHTTINVITSEFKTEIPFKMIKVDRAEGDDVIAVLAQKYPGPHIIISNDKDFIQLLSIPDLKIYAPVKKTFINHQHPDMFLKEQIIRGDNGDGIPNVFSDDDTFVNPDKRQKPIFSKNLKNWLNAPFSSFVDVPDNLERNNKCINFKEIPSSLEEKIVEEFTAPWEKPKANEMYNYFVKHRMKNMIEDIQSFY